MDHLKITKIKNTSRILSIKLIKINNIEEDIETHKFDLWRDNINEKVNFMSIKETHITENEDDEMVI